MIKIDKENWNRKEHFNYYHSLKDPRYSVTFEVDVTDIYEFAKKNNLSFYYSMVYIVVTSMNSIENFRLIIKEDDVYILDSLCASFTDLASGSDTFHISSLDTDCDIFEFNKRAKEAKNSQKSFYSFKKSPLEMVHISSVPWLYMTGLVREKNENGRKSADDTAPHVVWGKYKEWDGKKILNMNMEVNHQTVDGYHIGKFYETFLDFAKSYNRD